MNDQMYKEAMYSGFFNELELLEKQQMLEKQAIGLGTLAKGFKQVFRDPRKALGGMKHSFQVGQRRAAGLGRGQQGPMAGGVGNRLRQAWGGAKNVARTPAGQAALAAGGGVATVGVGAALGSAGDGGQ